MYGYGFMSSFRPASTVSMDPDAQAFITAASITDPTQQEAVNQLVVDLKGYSLWTKMKAVYPMVGGTSTSMKWNLKDPRDLDAAFRLSFAGGWSFSANGADPNGTTAYADTFFTPTTWNDEHLSFYSGENTATATAIDIGSVSSSQNRYYLSAGVSSTTSTNAAFYDPILTGTDAASGFHTVTVNGASVKLYKNSSNTDTDTKLPFGGPAAGSVWIGAANSIGYYSNRQCRFASFGTGLSDTDVSNLYTAVQAFQTTLGRSIGTQTVSDSDAQAFVTAASITDQVEAEAVNQLVIDLKAASLWTKMKRIYPFVGSAATPHRYDLVTATADISWNGGITHNQNGVTFNGTTGYGVTGINVSTIVPSWGTDSHISIYCRTKNPSGNGFAMGVGNTATGDPLYGLVLSRGTAVGSPTYYDTGNFSGNGRLEYLEFPNGDDARAFYVGSTRANNDHELYKDGNTIASSGLTVTGTVPNAVMHIGKYNPTSGSDFYQGFNAAFISVGTELTDSEVTSFTTIVETFNTALSRNV